jgi:uncharacterized repeat protein (TIGR03843 family)
MPLQLPDSPVPIPRALKLLQQGNITEMHGLLPWGSNYTYLMSIDDIEFEAKIIYKPQRGERPLWDFPDGTLCKREVAAFLISEELGWHIVPPTVLREGPQGLGMIQLFIEHDPEQHYFTFAPEVKSKLERIALFDLVVNNADRKGGHSLLDSTGFVWAIDHGICFHVQPKLRTVIWDFAGCSISRTLMNDLEKLLDRLSSAEVLSTLRTVISAAEANALIQRVSEIRNAAHFPEPSGGRQYPWPPV